MKVSFIVKAGSRKNDFSQPQGHNRNVCVHVMMPSAAFPLLELTLPHWVADRLSLLLFSLADPLTAGGYFETKQ